MWLDYLGKFHPVVLHLPIGALLFTFLIALVALKEDKPFRTTIKMGLIFSFFGALVSSILGYLLYQAGGYEDGLLPPVLRYFGHYLSRFLLKKYSSPFLLLV
jgi:uncharacterized membrane protein